MKRVRLAQFAVFFLLVASVSVWAQTEAQQETKQETKAHCPSPRPSFPSMTYDEDNRYLRNPECRTEFLDRLKYVPLGENEDYYLSFGVSIRERGEILQQSELGKQPSRQRLPLAAHIRARRSPPG